MNLTKQSPQTGESRATASKAQNFDGRSEHPAFIQTSQLGDLANNSTQVAQLIGLQSQANGEGIVQREKTSVESSANLRSIGDEHTKISIKKGTEVDVVIPIESLQFDLAWFSRKVTKDKGPWHTKVKYNGVEYWVKNKKLIGSDREATVDDFQQLELVEDEFYESKEDVDISEKIDIISIPEFDLMDFLEKDEYNQNPKVAPVEEQNRMNIGGNIGYKDGIDHPDQWKVKVASGKLQNQENNDISGGGAWVLGPNGTLYGSQASDKSNLFEYKDMDSHELAPVIGPMWAGEMTVVKGKVWSINNQSGTYHFKAEANANILLYLVKNNVITLEQIQGNEIEVKEWRQRGMDREGVFIPWFRLTGAGRKKDEEPAIDDYYLEESDHEDDSVDKGHSNLDDSDDGIFKMD